MTQTRQRDYSIDVIKCLAALLITHSHLEPLLGKYSMLASGGAFGDSLFFFCSGYTLALSQYSGNFMNWYKRRINRIYPTVFAWALITAILFNSDNNMLSIIISGGGFFVSCIMIFYIFFFFLKDFIIKNYILTNVILMVIYSICFLFIDHNNIGLMYKWIWSMYFLPMIMGAICGKRHQENKLNSISRSTCVLIFIISIISYYLIIFASGYNNITYYIKPLIIIPQLGFTYSLYELCNSNFVHRVYDNKFYRIIILFIGSLCLEVYIVQPKLIHNFAFTQYFPLNIPIMYLLIFSCAYILKCLSKLWAQTFEKQEYDLKQIFNVLPRNN